MAMARTRRLDRCPEKVLFTCCKRGEIPLGVIALEGQELCGFALLIAQDFERRPNLSPWLAGVFVRPHYRKRGVGSALVTRIESEAKALGFETLYLYTGQSESLYRRLGWKVAERCVITTATLLSWRRRSNQERFCSSRITIAL